MRKNNRIITLAVAAAVMMAVTACGSKDKTETAAATEAATEATTEAAKAAATTEASSESTKAGEMTEETEDTDEGEDTEGEDGAEEETTASPAGEVGSEGLFQAASGKFEIRIPDGWTIDDGGDDEYVTFFSPNGEDMLEIMNLSGNAADSAHEDYPDTAEEYKKIVSRGDNMEILSYDVKTKEDGSQTFQYSIKYNNPADDVHYLAASGSYDAAKKSYIGVTGTVMSEDEGVAKQVEEAVKSFKIK